VRYGIIKVIKKFQCAIKISYLVQELCCIKRTL